MSQSEDMDFADISALVEDLAHGRPILLVDDEDRENEGDIVIGAQHVTAELIVEMNRVASGIITVPMPASRLRQLGIELMVPDNLETMSTAFTVSVDAARGIETGSSAFDRAETIKRLADPCSRPEDFVRPGHVGPLRVREGGVLRRTGHTEASHDLMVLAGLEPVAVLCEVMGDDGRMMRLPALRELSKKLGYKLGTIASLVRHRHRTETLFRNLGAEEVRTPWGPLSMRRYESAVDGTAFTAFVHGVPSPERPTLVRMHPASLTGDLVATLTRSGSGTLHECFERIAAAEAGVLLYIERNPRSSSVRPMDDRDYGVGAQVLRDLGVGKMRLMATRVRRRVGLEGFGLEMVEHVRLGEETAGDEVTPRPARSADLHASPAIAK